MMDADELRLVQIRIASILDHPSVYMGGPSQMSMRLAARIVMDLGTCHRIHSTKCPHATWRSYREHGTCCPTCGTNLQKSPEA